MRIECKHYESRTYANGETVRKCDLDLAPEAPWRCPENCPKYERRMVDTAWSYGTAIAPPTPDEPASVSSGDGSVSALLDEAEGILNSAGPGILAEVEAQRAARTPRWRRLFRRNR
jgi:hypothetical protein